jgi:hypothetical protein
MPRSLDRNYAESGAGGGLRDLVGWYGGAALGRMVIGILDSSGCIGGVDKYCHNGGIGLAP